MTLAIYDDSGPPAHRRDQARAGRAAVPVRQLPQPGICRLESAADVGGFPAGFCLLGVCTHARRLKLWPDIGAAVPASLTGELRGSRSDSRTPAVGVDDDRMRATIVAAINKQPASAGFPHFPESYFLFAVHLAQCRTKQETACCVRVAWSEL
jgi:hypothetical protein